MVVSAYLMVFVGLVSLVGITQSRAHFDTLRSRALRAYRDSLPVPGLDKLSWSQLPEFPDAVGVAGACIGGSGDTLIVAGGSNFPHGGVKPADKRYHDDIWTMTRTASGWRWERSEAKLPRPLAYSACVSDAEGVICAGGQDSDSVQTGVFRLDFPRAGAAASIVQVREMPALPVGITFAVAALVGRTFWVISGQTRLDLASANGDVWALDLDDLGHGWRRGPAHPGPPRALAVAAVNGEDVFVMSGRRELAGGKPEFLRDCWRFRPAAAGMPGAGPWQLCAALPSCVMGGVAGVLGGRVVVLSGDDGALFGQVLGKLHPGYPKKSYVYEPGGEVWGVLPTPESQVTTSAVAVAGGLLLTGGEVKPGIRTNHTWLVGTRALAA